MVASLKYKKSNWKPNKICVDEGNSTKNQWSHSCRVMVQKYIEHIIKKNLLSLNDLLDS